MLVVKHFFKSGNRVVNVQDGGLSGQFFFILIRKKPCDRAQGL
ncbi:hypothetical protein J699_01568 [Acinetobacter sp. 1000160]|nr:hypothetical protein J522_0835 [Acinetobacter baumannii 146457]EYT21508.1 hypothetical protein J699_01568 [Acinetobacter sp. 1000160]